MSQEPSGIKPGRYDCRAIETRWQKYWEENQSFRAINPSDSSADTSRPKFYILDMFPYPSGAGLHVGHPLGYCATDIVARYKRMRGFNVLHPMGFDAFGLPAEQYAVETNVHPAITTQKNIEMYRRQLRMFGFSYDWKREFATSDPKYYKFTQWMFARMYDSWYDADCSWIDRDGRSQSGRARPIRELVAELESGRWGADPSLALVRDSHAMGFRRWNTLTDKERSAALDRQRLAFLDEVPVNWCPALGTVLSNEEVDNEGRSERGRHPVYRRPLKQWMLRITCYTERLLSDLEPLDWPEPIKLMQRNWIGKSTGAEILFPLADHWTIESGTWKHKKSPTIDLTKIPLERAPDAIRVYTTRPDTVFGATYMVIAPEHPLVESIVTSDQRGAIQQYVTTARHRTELDRTNETKEKTGVFTGAYAFNPTTGRRIPIWIADYVLMGYGSGAIMAVPGSDTRDFEFACKFDLPIVAVVKPSEDWIKERLHGLTDRMDEVVQKAFDAIMREVPEHQAELQIAQERSSGLQEKTLTAMRKDHRLPKLIEHYLRHPKFWKAAFIGEGHAANSPEMDGKKNLHAPSISLNGLTTMQAKVVITEWLERQGLGRSKRQYKLRDWLFSRQRYWGEPFPVLHGEDGQTILMSDDELPLELPTMADFKPTPSADEAHSLPEPPLGRAKEWLTVTRNGRKYHHDLNTMPNWAGSCWYYLRFIDPENAKQFCDSEAEKYWMPVDLYVGGAEHAVLHLLYARFWHKVLFDLGYVSGPEPFMKLFNQGKIQGFAFRDSRGNVVGPDAVEQRGEDDFVLKNSGEPVTRIVAKMSKSLKNVVNPDEIIAEYGADTFRIYEMYMGPLETDKPWNTRDVPGLFKLCQRIWRLVVSEQTGELSPALCNDPPDEENLRALHKLIQKVGEDIEQLKLNTAIAAIFDFVNIMTPKDRRFRAVIEPFILTVAPFTPHLAEELWNRLGHKKTLTYEPWPKFDPKLTRDEQVEVGVQIGGKLRARILIPADADEKATETAALADPKVMEALAGKTVRKVIVVKGRLVNIITG
ncbi:MAG: class I tRNA ligase family protein [Planctomycetota bacterium]